MRFINVFLLLLKTFANVERWFVTIVFLSFWKRNSFLSINDATFFHHVWILQKMVLFALKKMCLSKFICKDSNIILFVYCLLRQMCIKVEKYINVIFVYCKNHFKLKLPYQHFLPTWWLVSFLKTLASVTFYYPMHTPFWN